MFHIVTLLLLTRASEFLNQRALVAVLQNVWTLPCLIALRFWPGVIKDPWGTYALIVVLLSYPYNRMFHSPGVQKFKSLVLTRDADAINGAWVSRNSNNVGTRTVASALYNVRHPPSLPPCLIQWS